MGKPKYLKKKQAAAAAGSEDGADKDVSDNTENTNGSPTTTNALGKQSEAAKEEPHSSGAMVSFANPVYRQGVNDILVEKLDISYQGNAILENATLNLVSGHRYGLVGPNGCGKSTLLRVLGCHEIPFPSHVDRYYVSQEVEASDMSALDAVLAVDKEREKLESEMEDLALGDQEDPHVLSRLDDIYKRLDELDADTAAARAGKILFGLGFTKEMQRRPTKAFSGGWRMRISLAQALFINPTVLLLDEPTNHLDIEAVVWLENYLSKFKKTLFMVSHSQDFMNNVCTDICHMHLKKLNCYDGNYDQYCITREEKESNQMKKYQWEQNQIKNMKEYIARFGHGSAKLARQAQSKEKTLAKMTRGGLTDAVVKDSRINFEFPCAGPLPPPMLQFREVSFNYPGRPSLFTNLDLGVNMDSRICLVGPNGAGKTTLTKLMCRELEPTAGYVAKNAHCVMARFHQHFVDQINMDLTPLEWMSQEYPDVTQPPILRSALGRFGVSGKAQMTPMKTLSDGQKSRVVFAWMAYKRPHFMILDEPTNHLDIESIDALADAINNFEGAVVVVSHDLRLLAQVADEIWIVEQGEAKRFNGDIADYKEHVQNEVNRMMQNYAASL
ncbi:putative ATP-binding cassette protein subfamily F,member 2 [Leishmania major strain Friedlin]|uniref:Putative ATP-binding cassette protein subfamily F,member 2 n=1 Tax=Leishmania major TaxID=5664 RepID=Q4QDE1_LEIMA|nr:putative ATP-binding cassette protein subfamily F,member 2 [Leishmania major strain Friedlin]CAG9572767.1 ATP-binding_cassette_protein_subfamily_F_member_2/ABCF2 [Leishmania major strain Friedlin]CAJ07165.1 putative ATP-binding cassette protein subfamily F,member 2 [Leishmania major strain Friedlin]|eukprot:XP_001682657.1 putative ATP-binding cassette protein subfamily F,member 2 [Leishmania major strain Friedlin]